MSAFQTTPDFILERIARARRARNDPFPGCDHCSTIVQDPQARQWTLDNFTFSRNDNWSASHIFHDTCESSNRHRVGLDQDICAFCQHLNLSHLSFCLPSKDLPSIIPIPEPPRQPRCPLCQVFREFLGDQPPKYARQVDYPLYLSISEWRSQQVQWRLIRSDAQNQNVGYLVVQEQSFTCDSNDALPFVGPILEDISHIKKCISDCFQFHEWCNPASRTALPKPFRLIDASNECISSSWSGPEPSYLALSYVWGDIEESDENKSTLTNISRFSQKLDFQSLPATVRDAIVVCKLLGQQYLWVDRFCILQDDEDDKAIQIEAMSAVFSRASLVIVAASGDGVTNGLSGISRRRQGQFYKDISNIQVNLQLPFLWDLVGPSIWDSRGWTYQEAMLSARKIFFTDAQVFFECTVGINHEEHLAYSTFDPSTHKMNRKQEYSTLTSTLEYGLPRLIETQLHRPQHLWDRTELRWAAYARHVQRYRQRSLRHKSDILNAFMGILTALYSNEKQYYGVPLPEFDLTMLWEPSSVHHRLAPKDTVAVTHDPPIEFPSWTWASSSSEVSFSNIERNFRGSLCLWFKPGSQSDLEPIIATSDSVEVFKASEDETKVSLALAIAHGLIEIYQNKESMAWIELNFDDLHHAIDGKWPAYSDFWMEIFGQDESLDRAKQQLTQALGAPLTAGMLATRTQVAKVNIIDQKPSSLIPVGGNERAIGRVFDNSDQIRNLMRLGVPAFDCMALSISDVSSWNILSGYGKVSPEDSFTDRDGKTLKRVPVVNVLVLRRDKGCCFRIGIGQVYLKQWIDLGARFETIVLA